MVISKNILKNQSRSTHTPIFTKSPLLLESQQYPSKFSWNHYPTIDDHVQKMQETPHSNGALARAIEEHDIHVVGIDLSITELRALRAVQRLFTSTNYQGNVPERSKTFDGNNSFFFTGTIVPLRIKIVDFLVSYQVNKKVAGDGKARFNSNEREEALKALFSITSKMFYFYFTRKKWESSPKRARKEKIDVIQTVSPLFKLYTFHSNISTNDLERLLVADFSAAKINYLIIEPTPIMLLDIDNYFILLPPYEQDIRKTLQGKRVPREVYTFTGYLIYQAEIKRSKKTSDWLSIQISVPTLIHKLRLENYFSRSIRNPSRAYEIIEKCIECAYNAEYLVKHTYQDETYTFHLNAQKFYHQNF